MSDLVIIKVRDGVNLKTDMMGHWRKEIMKQKEETGVVILPWFLTTVVVPEDTEIQFEKE